MSVGPEKQDVFAHFWEKNEMPFMGLPDPEQKVLKLYGQEVSKLKLGRLPAQMIIDKEGVLRYVHYGQSMSDVGDLEEILELTQSLNKEQ